MKLPKSIITAALAMTTMSCTTTDIRYTTVSISEYVENLASYEFKCPAKQIKLTKVGDSSFSVEGCTQRAIFKCKDKSEWYQAREIECTKVK